MQIELHTVSQNNENIAEPNKNNFKAVSFFKLQYKFLSCCDIVIVIFAVFGSIGTGIALPLFALFFGDTVTQLENVISGAQFVEKFREMCLNFVYVGVGTLFSGTLMVTLWTYNGRIITKRLRDNYFKIIMLQEQGYFDQTNTYEFCFKVGNQTQEIENGLGIKVGNAIFAVAMFISSFIVGYYTSWKLSLVISSILPVFLIGGLIIDKILQKSRKRVEKSYEEAGGIAEEVICNIKTVTSFANYNYELNRYNSKIEESYNSANYHGKLSSILIGIYLFLILNTFSLAVWYGAVLISNKEKNTHAGTPMYVGDVLVVVFTIVFGSLALGQAAPNLKAISNACIAAFDYFALIERIPKINVSQSYLKPNKVDLKGLIEFKNVKLAYPSKPDKDVFTNLNLLIQPGFKTAIVGESGSGKSTIASLIERFYDYNSGEIMMDNIPLHNFDLEYLRELIAYAPQEPVLFNQSIRENIKFGREDVSDEEILKACKIAQADLFVQEKGLDYVVGIRGGKLSAGQRQRLGIVRAIIKKPKVLILDEPTSSLDYQSEKLIQVAIDNIIKERGETMSTIIIANRLSTITNSDIIYVINNGDLAEQGDHNTLMKKEGLYARLISKELEENKNTTTFDLDKANNINVSNHDRTIQVIPEGTLKTNNDNENNIILLGRNGGESRNINFLDQNDLGIKRNNYQSEPRLIDKSNDADTKNLYLTSGLNSKIYSTYSSLFLPHKWAVIAAIFFLSCMGAIWPAYGLLLAGTFDALATPDTTELQNNGSTMALYFLLIAGVTSISHSFQSYLLVFLGENITKSLRRKIYEKYLSFHMGFYDFPQNYPGSLLAKLNQDSSKITGIALSMVGLSIQMLMAIIVGFILSIIYDWRLCLIAVGLLPLTIVFTICTWKAQRSLKDVKEKVERESTSILIDSITNTKIIFAYNMQSKISQMYSNILEEINVVIKKASIIGGFSFGIIMLIMFVSFGVMFYAGAAFLMASPPTLNLDNMLKSIFSILFALFGIAMSQQYIGDISKAKEALENIFNILNTNSEINPFNDVKTDNQPIEINGKIEFKDVNFAYPTKPDQPVLKNINFVITPGQKSAFIGFSGSGKSTILQLIERFYDTNKGEILIDDKNIKDYNISDFRKKVSLIMEEPLIFKRDIYENIRYGRLEANDQEVEKAAKCALIDKYVTPNNLKKVLNFSGGEKQRVALARAIIKEPKIMLLDEVTSALDKNSENTIKNSLDVILKDRTVLMVAHKYLI